MLTTEEIRAMPAEELAVRIKKARQAAIGFSGNTHKRSTAKGQLELEAALYKLAESEGFEIDLSLPVNVKHPRKNPPELCCSTCSVCESPILSLGGLEPYAGQLFCEDCAKNVLNELEHDIELMVAEQRLRSGNSHSQA